MTSKSPINLCLVVAHASVVDTSIASQVQRDLILQHGLLVQTLFAARMQQLALRQRMPSISAPALIPTQPLPRLCAPSRKIAAETQQPSFSIKLASSKTLTFHFPKVKPARSTSKHLVVSPPLNPTTPPDSKSRPSTTTMKISLLPQL
jgi:hypothetical protein